MQNIIFYSIFICFLLGLLAYVFYDAKYASLSASPIHVNAVETQNDVFFQEIKDEVSSEIAAESAKALESKLASEAAKTAIYNINTATKEQLISLATIGEVTAGKIIDYIAQNGKLNSIDELLTQKLVTARQFEAIKSRICI